MVQSWNSADVAFVQQLLDVGALRRMAKLVRDHRRAADFSAVSSICLGLLCIDREGLSRRGRACPLGAQRSKAS